MPAITPHPLVSGLTASAALAGCVLGKRLPLHKPDHYLGLSRQPFYLDWGNRDRELPAGWIPSDQWPGKGLPTRLSTFFSFDSRPLAPRDMLKIESRLRAINNVPSYDSPDSWARAINQMNQMFLELKHLRLRLITLGLSDNLLGLEEYFTINLEPVCDIFFAAFERHVMNLRNTDSLSPTAMKQYGDLAQAVSRLNATLAVIPLFYLGEADFLGKASLAYRKLYLRYPFIKLQKVLSPLGSSQTNPFDQQIVRQSILATDLERRTLLAGRVMTHEMYDKNLLTIAQSLLALATSSCDLLQSTPRPNPEEEQALLLLWQKKIVPALTHTLRLLFVKLPDCKQHRLEILKNLSLTWTELTKHLSKPNFPRGKVRFAFAAMKMSYIAPLFFREDPDSLQDIKEYAPIFHESMELLADIFYAQIRLETEIEFWDNLDTQARQDVVNHTVLLLGGLSQLALSITKHAPQAPLLLRCFISQIFKIDAEPFLLKLAPKLAAMPNTTLAGDNEQLMENLQRIDCYIKQIDLVFYGTYKTFVWQPTLLEAWYAVLSRFGLSSQVLTATESAQATDELWHLPEVEE